MNYHLITLYQYIFLPISFKFKLILTKSFCFLSFALFVELAFQQSVYFTLYYLQFVSICYIIFQRLRLDVCNSVLK